MEVTEGQAPLCHPFSLPSAKKGQSTSAPAAEAPRKEGNTMKLTITGRQMTVRDSLKELAEGKLAKYDRFFDEKAEAQITFSCRHGLETVEITIISNGTFFRAEEGDETFRCAIDKAMDALDRQLRKNKTRLERRLREGAFESFADENEEDPEERVIRVKTYPFKPMSVEEAAMQMDLLGHQFFVFVDQDNEKTCVVYRRKDGDYGLIIPQ